MARRLLILLSACLTTVAACSSTAHPSSSIAAAAPSGQPATTAASESTTSPGATTPATPTTAATAPPPPSIATAQPQPVGQSLQGSTATTAATPTSVATTAPPTTAGSGAMVSSTANPKYGQILVDAQGRTLYVFTPDDGASSPQCTGSCAQTWPPLKTTGTPRAGGQAKQSLLGVEDGQVTYNGHPLYRYGGDSGPGQTNGEGVGGIWYVISVSGSPVIG